MDLQYFCEKLSYYYGEFVNSVLMAERKELRSLIEFYLKCINDSINEEFTRPEFDL